MDTYSFRSHEHQLSHDLHSGHGVQAAVLLLNEFDKDPQQALSLINKEMQKNGQPGNSDKLHLNIDEKGEVFVWDKTEHNGYYAGTVPSEMRPQPQERVTCQPDESVSLPPPAQDAPPPPPVQEVTQAPPPPGPQDYEYSQPRHRGFHIPFPIDVGVHNGSLRLGLNILGLVKGGVTLGEHNRAYVGSDVANSEVSAGVDLSPKHVGPAADWHVMGDTVTTGRARVGFTPQPDGDLKVGGGADATAFGRNLGAGGYGGVELGHKFGPQADGYSYAGPAEASASGYANLSDQGLRAGTTTDVGAQPYLGTHTQTRFGLGAHNEAHADVGANVGDNGGSVGAGFYRQFHPDAYARGYSGDDSAGVGLIPMRAWTRHQKEPFAQPDDQ